jgi:hypothetical protein
MAKRIPKKVIEGLDYRLNSEIEISESNWKEFRNPEAKRQYPIGTGIQCGQSWAREPDYDNFFRVRKITPAGILVTDVLILGEVARDCGQGGGWIDYDPESARLSGAEVRFFPSLRFNNYVVRPYDKKTDRSAEWDSVCYIDWQGSKGSGYHFIRKLEPEKNGLVRAVMGGIL